jgi:serine/threonine protein kinase
MPSTDSAAAKLASLDLGNGWKVGDPIGRAPGATGGMFSHSYRVAHADGRKGFLKAFDFSEAFDPGSDTITMLRVLTTSFEHERDLLLHCKDRGHSKISVALEHGRIDVPGLPRVEATVHYIIFEMADGDIRTQVDASNRFNTVWCTRALRDVCLGLWQMHRDFIAHQDVKPSNVLVYKDSGDFKVGDLGRASKRGASAPHDGFAFPGDRTYAPPEFLYGYVDPDFAKRRIGADLFMLGNIACFLFAGVNIMALLTSHLAPQYRPEAWRGTYAEAVPYLVSAFTLALEDLRPTLDPDVRVEVLRMVRELCNPDVHLRGHKRGLGRHDQFSLERYVAELDLLSRRVEIGSRIKKAV